MPSQPTTAIIKVDATALATSVDALNPQLAGFLSQLGLPTENILAPMDERRHVIDSMSHAIAVLPIDERLKATYISKFTVAVTVGLFDAAITFLWDETIKALRKLAVQTDLSYFYDVAEKRDAFRKNLSTEEDIDKIGELALVDACERVGLLSSVNRERLRHINFMRNHASSAHPNDNEVQGAELVSWLSTCVRHVITARPNSTSVETSRLLFNVRSGKVRSQDLPVLDSAIQQMPGPRIDDLIWTLFGLYVDPKTSTDARNNIDILAPVCWKSVSEPRRHEVGARLADFVRHQEHDKRQLADQFLTQVGGLSYRTEEILVAELYEKLQALEKAHEASRNFYEEWPHAKALGDSLPATQIVPEAVRSYWVKVIVKCWIGNGRGYYEGVDRDAIKYYDAYLNLFRDQEIAEFLRLMSDVNFTDDFPIPKAAARCKVLVKWFFDRTTNIQIQRALQVIMDVNEKLLPKVHLGTAYRAALAALPEGLK